MTSVRPFVLGLMTLDTVVVSGADDTGGAVTAVDVGALDEAGDAPLLGAPVDGSLVPAVTSAVDDPVFDEHAARAAVTAAPAPMWMN